MERILKKIEYVGDCWIYTGSVNTDGYPSLTRKGYRGISPGNVKGHRYVFEMIKGEIPEGQVVRHTCDNKRCLNPDHLILGSSLDNVNDRVERGRTFCHISDDKIAQIKELRLTGLSQHKTAKMVGCSQGFISHMERGCYQRYN